ncbi:MAG: hypothetical protein AAFU77_16055 [Myxococcota bacterium]
MHRDNALVSLSGNVVDTELPEDAEFDEAPCFRVLGEGFLVDRYGFCPVDVRWGADGCVTVDGRVEKHIPAGVERVWAMVRWTACSSKLLGCIA